MSEVLLFSGGLDSYIAWHLLGGPDALYMALGHRYERAELSAIYRLESVTPDLSVIRENRLTLGDLERPDGYIPLRNLLLVCAAAVLEIDYRTIYIGALKGEASRDKSQRFLRDLSSMLTYLKQTDVRIVAPFQGMTKADLVGEFARRFPDRVTLLSNTFSCYTYKELRDDYQGCGQCNACFRRWVAMTLNGITEKYETSPRHYARNISGAITSLAGVDPKEIGNVLSSNKDATRALWMTR